MLIIIIHLETLLQCTGNAESALPKWPCPSTVWPRPPAAAEL